MAYDRYAFRKFEQECDDLGLTLNFVEHPQGGKRRAAPTDQQKESAKARRRRAAARPLDAGSLLELETLILEGRIRLKRNPVLISAAMSAVTEHDPFDNRCWLLPSATSREPDRRDRGAGILRWRSARCAFASSRTIHDSPNADYTAVEFWEGVVLCLALWGNAYAKKEFIGRRLVALTPLRCDLMDVRRNSAGQRVYRYSEPRGAADYSEDEIFHVRGFGGAGDMGLSPISFARQSLGTAMAADEFAGAMFANGMRPNAILTVDQVLKETQRKQVQENIVAPYLGSENAGGVMVLEAGMKFQAVTMTPEDSQFLETRAFHVEELCRWFRVPPFMVGHTEKTTSWGSGLEQQLIGFLTFSLRPYLSRIEQAVSRALIPAPQRQSLKPEFKVEGLLRTDSAARAQFYSVMVTNGIMTRNEVRRLENLPPLDGGDDLTVQSQNVPLSEANKLPAPAKVPAAA
jgi:HK97 family phage portal protein